MRIQILALLSAIAVPIVAVPESNENLNIKVTHAVECERKTRAGDVIDVHYKGTLDDGKNLTQLSALQQFPPSIHRLLTLYLHRYKIRRIVRS